MGIALAGGVIIKALVAAAQGLAGKTIENNVEFQEVLKCKIASMFYSAACFRKHGV